MKKYCLGFSIIEVMIVVAIIGILSAVGYANFSQGSEQSRDAQRQGDLRIVSTALDLYKSKYGRYPEGCNGPNTWSGHAPSLDCSSGNQYIVGLAPEFIPRLPQDPKLNGNDSGYAYLTNNEGSVYKLVAYKTVESEGVTYEHEFKICDTDNPMSSGSICADVGGTGAPAHCVTGNPSQVFETSYAVWGGFARPNVSITDPGYDDEVESDTEEVICAAP
jgi:prepilin-type N-terminal cleavage/methylation domain-containing protein